MMTDTNRIASQSATPQPKAEAEPSPQNELLERLGTTLSPDLLVQALTHRSFSHEHDGAPNYERLEFLGDAVLELVSTETLYRDHPDMNEGQLAKMRAKAVSEEALSAIARDKLKVGPYILLGRGEADSGGADKSSILCDIVESLIGATFVEHGIDEARHVVHRLVDDELHEVATEGPALDWKTSLTVLAHEMGMKDPYYRMSVGGPEYAQVFTASVVIDKSRKTDEPNETVIGTATGTSKRKAQLAAAEVAWHNLKATGSAKSHSSGSSQSK
jgi:ribonuclease III